MERVGRLTKNTASLVIARVVTSGLTFLLAIVINRNLGPEKAGIYNYAFALYTIFQVIPDFGIGNISIRDVSQDPSRMRRYFANIVSLRLILGCIAFALLMLTNFLSLALQSSGALIGEKFWVVFTLSFCLLIEQPLSNSLAENFIALEKLVLVAGVYLVMGIVKVALSIYLVTSGIRHVLVYLMLVYMLTYIYSIFHFYLLYRRFQRRLTAGSGDESGRAAAEALVQVSEPSGEAALEALLADYSFAELAEPTKSGETASLSTAPLRRVAPAGPPPREPGSVCRLGPYTVEPPLWRYLMNSAWPLAVVAAGVTIYAGMDIPILSWFRGDTEVGLYGAAGMFAKAFVFFTLALNMAVLPAVSKVGGKYPERLGRIWEHLLGYAWILVIPLAVIVPLLARPILVLQKHQFIEAWHATWLTMAAMNFTFMTAISFPFFIVIDRQRSVTKIVVLSLAVKGGLDFLTIPLWGYTGAAVTVLVSECVVFCLLAWTLSRELGHRLHLLRFAASPLLTLGSLYGAGFFLYHAFSGWKETFLASLECSFLISVILVAIYLGLGTATKAFSRRRMRELNDLLTV